jgi:hypothetical protein
VAIQIPEDLEDLEALAATYPSAPATVLVEPGFHPDVEYGELPIVRLDVEDQNTYVQFHTLPDASPESLARSITMAAVVAQLRKLVAVGVERELFWVSGFIPLVESGVADDTTEYARLCLPLDKIAVAEEPERVVFLARTA